ncbi:MAG: hypothetical protein LBG12_01130, partial [Synergistaceae bacterium]|nr:hypothetical protein [Synergistaceae bacterium]
MSANDLALTSQEQARLLPDFDESLRFLLERRYLDIANPERLELATNPVNDDNYDYRTALRIIRLDEVSHEDKADVGLHLLNMQNVLAAIKNDSQNVVFIVRGMKEKSALYYGLSQRIDYPSNVSVHEYADVLRQTLHGNFMGVKMAPLSADETFDEIV